SSGERRFRAALGPPDQGLFVFVLSLFPPRFAMTDAPPPLRPERDRTLPSPAELSARFSLSDEARRRISEQRRRLGARLAGERGPVVAVVGPCSIHDRAAALDYAERLLRLQRELGDDVSLVMRAYFEKPRTSLG